MSNNTIQLVAVTADPTISQTLHALRNDERQIVVFTEAAPLFASRIEDLHVLFLDEAAVGSGYLAIVKKTRKKFPGVDVVVTGGPKSDEVRLAERRDGVDYYIERPVEEDLLSAALEHRLALGELKAKAGIVGRSPQLEEILEAILQVAPTEVPILIEGESGTGKDVIAQAVHYASRRREAPYVAINCASLAEGVLESELFGHEKGAFTGAVGQRAGVFERAHKGTIFLDEVGEMSPNMQVRLLRVLESGEVLRVGGVKTLHVDVRVIAATNRSLKSAVADASFRQDLYYRLKGVSFHLPALRDRRDDIPLLVDHFIADANRRHGKAVRGIEASALRLIEESSWPGNIRELRNAIDTAVVLASDNRIGRAQIESQLAEGAPASPSLLPVPLNRSKGEAEREMIYAAVLAVHRDVRELAALLGRMVEPGALDARREVRPIVPEEGSVPSLAQQERGAIAEALRASGGNRRRAASMLGISERTLYRKIKEYGLI